MNWPSDSRKDDYYLNEEGMYEVLFSSQQPLARKLRKHCCNVMFPHIRQQLTDKLLEDRDNRIQAIEYENVGLQDEITAYQAQLQVSQSIAVRLSTLQNYRASGKVCGSL